MTDGDNHPVARADSLTDGIPQLIIESAAAHTSQRLVLDSNLRRVEILMGIIAPPPLSVITIA